MPFFDPKTSEKRASCTRIQEAGAGKMETIWTIWKHWTKKPYMVVQIFQFVSCMILVRHFLAVLGVAGLLKIVSFWVSKLWEKTRKTPKNRGFSVFWWR